MANRIKKGDHVIVIAGKDKGKRGDVVRVIGDKVVVSKHVGTDVTLDKVDYKFVKQDEILAVVE